MVTLGEGQRRGVEGEGARRAQLLSHAVADERAEGTFVKVSGAASRGRAPDARSSSRMRSRTKGPRGPS